jgi:hypothetical protein
MSTDLSWNMLYAARDVAAREGEDVAMMYGFEHPPVDPFRIAKEERLLIELAEDDFGSAFDGRIKYVGPRFLICCNTRYNNWPHKGERHTKVVFTLAHELGHFFITSHRDYLVSSKKPHGSFTEFTADPLVEQQADYFATGLLMPSRLFRPRVNESNFPERSAVQAVRRDFHVSLTGMLVRWVQLTDFPCAVIGIRNSKIAFGWVSEPLRSRGIFQLHSGKPVQGRDARCFIEQDPSIAQYREGSGSGAMRNWLDYESTRLLTAEHYFAVPHTGTVWVLAFCDENEMESRPWDDD